LAAIALALFFGEHHPVKRYSRTESEVAALSAALESYKADHGDYPRFNNTAGTGACGDNSALRRALVTREKVYFEFPRSMGGTDTDDPIKDPFGENYGYQYPGDPGRSGTNFFDLYSRAGSPDTNKWIKNW